MNVGPPHTARLESVLFRNFVAELNVGAAVEARVGLLVVQGGAVGVGGWAFGVARGLGLSGARGLGPSGGFLRMECSGEWA